MSLKMLKMKDVVQAVAISKAEIYRKIKEGKFPSQYNQGTRSVAWRSDEIEEYINSLSKSS